MSRRVDLFQGQLYTVFECEFCKDTYWSLGLTRPAWVCGWTETPQGMRRKDLCGVCAGTIAPLSNEEPEKAAPLDDAVLHRLEFYRYLVERGHLRDDMQPARPEPTGPGFGFGLLASLVLSLPVWALAIRLVTR